MGEPMTTEKYIEDLRATYDLVAVLSEKNDCQVLRMRNRQTDRDLILRKLPRPLEAYELLWGIRCENLPEIYDAIELEDGQIILEEYIDGITVAEVMQSGKYRPLGAKRILREVCHALTVLHERGIIHRDVKPENVMIEKTGRVVLVDLNASRKESAAEKDTVVMGTVGYASPEQLGLSQTDARTDIYAAGVLYNVMLTGNHPTQSFARGLAGRIVAKCTALNPAQRYQTAADLAKKL